MQYNTHVDFLTGSLAQQALTVACMELRNRARGVVLPGIGVHSHGPRLRLRHGGAVAHLRQHSRVHGSRGGGVPPSSPARNPTQVALHAHVAQIGASSPGVAVFP